MFYISTPLSSDIRDFVMIFVLFLPKLPKSETETKGIKNNKRSALRNIFVREPFVTSN
jgi:hypothetical protein